MVRRSAAGLLVLTLAIPLFVFAPQAGAQTASCNPDPKLANAHAATTPVIATLNGMPFNGIGNLDVRGAKMQSDQVGPGNDADSMGDALLDEDLVKVEILKSDTTAKVVGSPLSAEARAVTELANLEVNAPGVKIRADIIKADAKAIAKPDTAFTDNVPSTIVGLRVNDEWISDTEPGNRIPLPTALNGPNGEASYIQFHDRHDKSTHPTATYPYYKGEVEVTMIYIVIQDVTTLLAGPQKLEIMIAKSWAQAESPVGCFKLYQSVRGAAYVARVWPDGWYHDHFTFGYQSIPKTGGNAHQALVDQEWSSGSGTDDATVKLASLKTSLSGVVTPGVSSKSVTQTDVQDLCIDWNGQECYIRAGLIQTRANAIAFMGEKGVEAYESGHTVLVDVHIGDTNICQHLDPTLNAAEEGLRCVPKPNTKIDIGPFHITLNEQWGDPNNCVCGYQGINVRAIRIETGDGGADGEGGESPGNILIARSYAAAEYKAK